jgi:hypothetical protein
MSVAAPIVELPSEPTVIALNPYEEVKYNQREYNRRFIEKNADRIKAKTVCEVCCGTYTYFNKSKHLKSARHVRLVERIREPAQTNPPGF